MPAYSFSGEPTKVIYNPRSNILFMPRHANSTSFKKGHQTWNKGKTTISKEELIELYINQEKSSNVIAKEKNVSQGCVIKLLDRLEVPTRSKKEAAKLALLCRRSSPSVLHAISHMGEKSPHWKGGITIKHGYRRVYSPDHPRAKRSTGYYVREHILIWEAYNKCFLPKNMVIHHINGIKTDNRIENLVALTTDKHKTGTIQKILQTRIQELEKQVEYLKEKRGNN